MVQLHFSEYPEMSWTEFIIHNGKYLTISDAISELPGLVADTMFPDVLLPNLGSGRLPAEAVVLKVC